jgi:tetratricopeptide (TPR) repeat protein
MRPVPILAVVFLITVAPAAAQERELPSEWLLCLNEAKAYTPDIEISGCNAVIRSRDRTPREYAIAFNNRGLAYRSLGDTARAFADYGSAIERDPSYASAFNNRGAAYGDIGDFDHAIEDYSEALRIGPTSAIILTNRGIAQHDKGDLDRAIADYNEAIRIDPAYAGAFTHRGNAYREKGDIDRAAADYSAAVELDPMRWQSTIAAPPTSSWAMSSMRSPIFPRPSGSIRNMPSHSTIAAWRGATRATSPTRSSISARR